MCQGYQERKVPYGGEPKTHLYKYDDGMANKKQ